MSAVDANTEVAELAGGFVHELKNHVGTLNLNIQLLAEEFTDPQTPRERRAKQRLDRIQNECKRIVEVSNDFLRFTRAQELRRTPGRLDDLVTEVVDFVMPTARRSNITVNQFSDPTIPEMSLDRDLIKQAILNLVLNAEQAMPDGGEIVLQTRRDGEYACLDVIDTGSGIPPEVMPKLFRPFHTTKPGGTGLGLPTTRKIIQAHGGEITVQSDSGRGTKFSVKIPIETGAPSRPIESA